MGRRRRPFWTWRVEYRTDSLVLAFEEAIQKKAESSPISKEERYVLAVEALEREVNNGGYDQFFLNSSHDFMDVIKEALVAIGCPKTAAITRPRDHVTWHQRRADRSEGRGRHPCGGRRGP